MINRKDYAVVTEKALRSGHIGFAYRKRAVRPHDSGWRMMYDKQEDRLDLANPDKVYACDIGLLLDHFPELEAFLKEKKYTVVEEADGSYRCALSDRELTAVPNKMADKDKYGAFAENHGPSVFTADPADMKSRGKKEWEKLIPEERGDDDLKR